MDNKKTADDILNMIRDRQNDKDPYNDLKAASAKALKEGDYDLVNEIHEELIKYPQFSKDLKSGKRVLTVALVMIVGFFGYILLDFVYESPEDKAKDLRIAEQKAEKNRKGFHCLSAWDGGLIYSRPLKDRLRDPDSYQHVSTRITPNNNGIHTAYVSYRAKNGFGGYVNESIGLKVSNSSCKIIGTV